MLHPQQFSEYAGNHRPDLTGPAMHDMESTGIPDVYSHPEYYGDASERHHHETVRAINAARGRPDSLVTMYRAVPKGVNQINPGDWVTPSRSYARNHSYDLEGPGKHGTVISQRVPARHLRWAQDYLPEFGYQPE